MSTSTFLSLSMLQFIAAYAVVVIVPGPVTFAAGSLAVMQGFSRTLPLLAGIGVGRAALTAMMMSGAIHLAAILSLPVARICGALVLCWMAWRMVRAIPPTIGDSSRKLDGDLFIEGVVVGFLSPQTAAFYTVAIFGLMPDAPRFVDGLAVVTIAATITVGWHAVVAALFSHPVVRDAALRHHRAISRTAATTICFMACYSVLPAVAT